MRIVDGVAIAAAERVERAGGPHAGLFAWRKLADGAGSPELRATALFAALRCAATLGDVEAIHPLALQWEGAAPPPPSGTGAETGEIVLLCRNLARRGLLVPATAVAYAEAPRAASALAHYLYARCLDVAGDRRAADAFDEAIARAETEGAADVARASRVRRAAWLSRRPETIAEAVALASSVDPRDAPPEDRLALARVMLRAPSRFARASALGACDELVSRDSPLALPETRTLAARALVVAARHADELGEGLTSLEIDRLLALLSREPIAKDAARAKDAVRAIDRMARAKDDAAFDAALGEAARAFPELGRLHRRARDVLAGRLGTGGAGTGADGGGEPRSTWDALLDAADALLRPPAASAEGGANARAAHALRTLAEREESLPNARPDDRPRLPAEVWSVAVLALASDDAEIRGASGRLAAAMLASRAGSVPRTPPRGFVHVAVALAAAGFDELATHARRLAALAKERGAEEALALALTRAGWELALGPGPGHVPRAGDRARALARLREARSMAANRSG